MAALQALYTAVPRPCAAVRGASPALRLAVAPPVAGAGPGSAVRGGLADAAGRACRARVGRSRAAGVAVRAAGRKPAGPQPAGSPAPFDPLGMLLDEELESDAVPGAMMAVAFGCLAGLVAAGPASAEALGEWDGLRPMPVSADMSQLAVEGPGPPDENFWANVLSYIRFFFSIVTGLVYVILKPFLELLKKPQTAVFVIAGGAAFVYFIKFTIDAMLGLNDVSDQYFLY